MSNEESKIYKLDDEKQREDIQFKLDRNFMVEAGAGSGKTSALVQRMVNQIISGKFKAEEIVAITFTKKAAQELKNRFYTELENTHRLMINFRDNKVEYIKLIYKNNIDEIDIDEIGTNLNKGIGNIIVALKNIDKCYIGTIHSFCSKLLRERPIEANVSPIFAEMDDIEESEFQIECWKEFINQQYKLNCSKIKSINNDLNTIGLMIGKDISIDDLIDTYKRLSKYDGVEIVYKEFNKIVIDELCNQFVEVARQINIPNKDDLKNLNRKTYYKWEESIIDGLGKLDNSKGTYDKVNIIINIIASMRSNDNYRGNDDEQKKTKSLINELKKINVELNKIYEYYVYDKCMKFIKNAIDYYNLRKQEESKLGFQDLLVKARNLLRDNAEARKYLGNKYKYLLIDEFQDTDPIQAEIMLFLTSVEEDAEKKDWRQLQIKKGSLFIVGDPKQSIYRFRNADISIYNKVKYIIEENEKKYKDENEDKDKENDNDNGILKLTTNFRTVDTVCNWFNDKLEKLLEINDKDDEKYQATFEQMKHVKILKSKQKEVPIYQLIIKKSLIGNLDSYEEKKEKNNRLAAEKIAQYIKKIISSNKTIVRENKSTNEEEKINITYKDFMILTKGKAEVQIYVKELENQGIPCIGTGKFTLGNNYIIKSLINLLKCINDPRDKIAYVGALKGCFGVSDKMLLEEYKEDPYFNFTYKKEYITEENKTNEENDESEEENSSDNDLIKEANIKIKKYINLKKDKSPITILEKIIEELNLMPYILIDENNKGAYKEVYNIIERLKSDEECCYDFNNMVKKIEEICKKEEKEISHVSTEEVNAVRVMNVHQSKGLEAEIVILASPKLYSDRDSIEKEVQYIDYTDSECKGYFVISKDNVYNPKNPTIFLKPAEWERIEEKAKKYNQAENKRLQYVAATRAKHELIIICNDENHDDWMWEGLYDKELDELIIEEESSQKEKIEKNEKNQQNELNIFDITKWKSDLKQKTYEFKIPTDYKNKSSNNIEIEVNSELIEKDNNQEDTEVKNAEWGTIVHKIFEKLVKNEKYLEEHMKYELKNSKDFSDDIDELKAEVERFKKSNVYKLIEDARKNNRAVYSELSFGVKVDDVKGLKEYLNDNTKQSCGEKEVFINGVIDLIIETEDGWHIVDYKSNSGDFAKKAKVYAPQLNIYTMVWEHLSKGKGTKASLYSTVNGCSYLIN